MLIVEDDEDLRIIYADSLTHHGYRTLVAADGEEALTMAKAHSPDLALVDIMMPGMSGREVAARLRERHPEVAIIFVTALDEVEVAVEEMRHGAFHYLTKPVELHQLLEVVEEAWAVCRARTIVRVEGLVVDLREGYAHLDGEITPLTPKESALLAYLRAVRAGRRATISVADGVGLRRPARPGPDPAHAEQPAGQDSKSGLRRSGGAATAWWDECDSKTF